MAIFDIRVMDTECPLQCGSNPGVFFKHHEVKKKQTYLAHCESECKHFTPLVFLVDRMMKMECDAARKRLVASCTRFYYTPTGGRKPPIVAVIGGYDVTLGVFIRGRKNDRGLKRRNDLFPKYLCWTPIGPLLGDVFRTQ